MGRKGSSGGQLRRRSSGGKRLSNAEGGGDSFKADKTRSSGGGKGAPFIKLLVAVAVVLSVLGVALFSLSQAASELNAPDLSHSALERMSQAAPERSHVGHEAAAVTKLQKAARRNTERLSVHRFIEKTQAAQRHDGAAVQLDCRSKGNNNLMSRLKVGEGMDVLCASACDVTHAGRGEIGADRFGEQLIFGNPSHYAERSAVCLAGLHALGLSTTSFRVTIVHTFRAEVPSESKNGITSGKTKPGHGFVVSAPTLTPSEVPHKTHVAARHAKNLHAAYHGFDKDYAGHFADLVEAGVPLDTTPRGLPKRDGGEL
jgi:hypothetical protein